MTCVKGQAHQRWSQSESLIFIQIMWIKLFSIFWIIKNKTLTYLQKGLFFYLLQYASFNQRQRNHFSNTLVIHKLHRARQSMKAAHTITSKSTKGANVFLLSQKNINRTANIFVLSVEFYILKAWDHILKVTKTNINLSYLLFWN